MVEAFKYEGCPPEVALPVLDQVLALLSPSVDTEVLETVAVKVLDEIDRQKALPAANAIMGRLPEDMCRRVAAEFGRYLAKGNRQPSAVACYVAERYEESQR